LLLALSILAVAPAYAQGPLFTFVQISDSQADGSRDQERFELVLDTIAAGGQSGALLPRRVDLVVFPGDLVWHDDDSEWETFVETMDSRLTANGIPYFAVPGNHDHSDFGFERYERYIASSDPWDFGTESFVGHNGVAGSLGWKGLRFVGVNGSNGGDGLISAADVSDVESRVFAAAADDENVFVVSHFSHDHDGSVPLLDALETPEVRGYLRGHSGSTDAKEGLDGTSNDEAWELNSQSIVDNGALIYYEVFETEIDVYVLKLNREPTGLPAADTISLAHPLVPADGEPPSPGVVFQPTADAKVRSSRADRNYGPGVDLRVKNGSSIYESYVQFHVTGLDGSVVSAVLRLYVTDGSSDGGTLYEVDDGWTETGITWNNAPPIGGAPLGALGAVSPGWVELDVSALVTGNGSYSFALTSGDSNSAYYSSREGTNPPELRLVVESDETDPPTADFDAVPTAGSAPLSVAFSDLSTGSPASWFWDFGDGATSALQDPVHTYTEVGVYSVTLTVTNDAGSDSVMASNLVSVGSISAGVTFEPAADAKVRSSRADKNYGQDDDLRVKDSTSIYESYLKFEVTGLGGPISSAVLRLYVTEGSSAGGTLYEVDGSWTETGITWDNAPAIGSVPIVSAGAVSVGWIELDVSAVVTGEGAYSFVLTSDDSNSAYYSSREGANPPELTVTTSP
jgi:PKD repeat protein